jgi:hypothetical protein
VEHHRGTPATSRRRDRAIDRGGGTARERLSHKLAACRGTSTRIAAPRARRWPDGRHAPPGGWLAPPGHRGRSPASSAALRVDACWLVDVWRQAGADLPVAGADSRDGFVWRRRAGMV